VGTFEENPSPIYDTIPQGRERVSYPAADYTLDNYFSIQVSDASGDIRTQVSPAGEASLNFYPGSRRISHLNKPALLSPVDSAVSVTNAPTLRWSSAAQNIKQLISYTLTMSTNADLSLRIVTSITRRNPWLQPSLSL